MKCVIHPILLFFIGNSIKIIKHLFKFSLFKYVTLLAEDNAIWKLSKISCACQQYKMSYK